MTMMQHSPRRWALGLALLLGAATVPLGSAAAQGAAKAAPSPAQTRTGAQIFSTTCAACHQAHAEGTDVYPPLAGSEWVNGADNRLVRIILHGLNGEVEVQGNVYNGAMPAWGPSMSDAEIAAVATYIRSNFGNKAPPVDVATVAQARAEHATRKTPWTVAELLLIKAGDKK